MAKKSRKTKAKTSDFQKTKLKVGKKRPLPSNVTEVAFKSQAIYIAEQMKNVGIGEKVIEGKESVTKRNIPELLSQVGHFNKNFRVDSLTSLRNSFLNDKALLRDNLPKVFSKVPHSIRDDDQQVRKSSITFFKCVFSEISSQEMAPFFDAFLLHLYCAMTHVYDDVKKDSLQIFDLCIKYFPDLLTASSSDKLLQHFIDLISTKQTRSAAKEGKADVTRVLSMKLSSKESSIVWRNRVLERLYDLLSAYGESCCGKGAADKWQQLMKEKYGGHPIKCGSPESGVILTKFASQKYFRRGFSSKTAVVNTNLSKEKRLSPWELVTTLVPLLIDTWHEATSDESKQFSVESVTAMTNVLKITNILIKKFINSHDDKIQAILELRDRHLQDFQKYFFDFFPINYDQKQSQPNRKRRKTARNDTQGFASNVHSINLSISEMITTLFPNELIGKNASLLASVAEHLSSILVVDDSDSKMELDETGLKQFIAVTKALLDAAVDEETVDSLLRPLLVLFHCSDAESVEKVELLNFFASLYSDFHFPRTEVMDEWVCSLPIVLAEMIHGKGKVKKDKSSDTDKRSMDVCRVAISTMRLAFVKENMPFIQEFSEKMEFLLEIMKDECHRCTKLSNQLFELFLHPLCDVTIDNMKLMIQICQKECIPAESVGYAANLFLLRYERYGRKPADFTASIQFLSSLLTGIPRCDLLSLQSSNDKNHNFYNFINSTESQFLRHSVIVERICSFLKTIDHVKFIMRRFFREKLLHKYQVFPTSTAFAIIKAVVQLDLCNNKSTSHPEIFEENIVDEFISGVGKFVSAILFHCHGNEDSLSSAVQRSLTLVCVAAMKLNVEILRACIKEFGEAGCKNCEVVCLTIGFLLSQSELRDNLNLCKSELNKILENMKIAYEGETAIIESTIFSVSATLSSAP